MEEKNGGGDSGSYKDAKWRKVEARWKKVETVRTGERVRWKVMLQRMTEGETGGARDTGWRWKLRDGSGE